MGAGITLRPQPAVLEGFKAISALAALGLLPWQRVSVVSFMALQGFNQSPHRGWGCRGVKDLVGAPFITGDTQVDSGLTS